MFKFSFSALTQHYSYNKLVENRRQKNITQQTCMLWSQLLQAYQSKERNKHHWWLLLLIKIIKWLSSKYTTKSRKVRICRESINIIVKKNENTEKYKGGKSISLVSFVETSQDIFACFWSIMLHRFTLWAVYMLLKSIII